MPSSLRIYLSLLLAALTTAAFFRYIVLRLVLFLAGRYLRSKSADKREFVLQKLGEDHTFNGAGLIIGFFHPYCNAGGGGERVLWTAIRRTQKAQPDAMCVVYTGDHTADKETIIAAVEDRFHIRLEPDRLFFMYLSTRYYISPAAWPRFTLLGQSLGSLFVAWDAFSLMVPDIWIDTMGYAFTLPMAKLLFHIPTAAYVHYPTISTDMLAKLSSASSPSLWNRGKRWYWQLFAALYARCGNKKYVDVVMANGSWTAAHIRSLWKRSDVHIIFPPCAVSDLLEACPSNTREKVILCIAQFRPEKNHALLIEAFSLFLHTTKEHKDAKLVLVGSVRNAEDELRIYDLRIMAREARVSENVEFVTNAPWEGPGGVLEWLRRASIGANAMWNEHFGIGVVEYQAAGLVSVVHDSGGPKLDIVVDVEGEPTGFHANGAEEFAEGFEFALGMDEAEMSGMRERARRSARRFDEDTFETRWEREVERLVELVKREDR